MEFQTTPSLDSMDDVAAESASMDYSADENFESMAGLPSQPVQQAESSPVTPTQAPPIPASGLPPGWTEEQWKWYGHEWLAKNANQ